MAFLKRITPYAIVVLLLAVFYVRVPPPLGKTPYEHLQTFSLNRTDFPSVQATPYEYLVFVVQWPFALCAQREYCTYDGLPDDFKIHGLWPANDNGARIKCTGIYFNLTEMRYETRLQTDLRNSWPNLECDNYITFWKREYDKHGRCCDNIFNQTEYFKTAHKMWLKHRVEVMFKSAHLTPGQRYEPYKLKAAVKERTKKLPALRCTTYTEKDETIIMLLEVVICFDHDGKKVTNCPRSANARCGGGTVPILWKGSPKNV